MHHRVRLAFVCVSSLWVLACGGAGSSEQLGEEQLSLVVPAKGSATTLDVGSWNIEWFGSTGNGPTNETLQLNNVRDVVSGADLDIWGFEEVTSASHWASLKSQLPGYSGFLANESNVVSGSTYYAASEQKVGILYKSALASVQDARIILTASDTDFAGRPPLQVKLQVTLNGTTEEVVVIVVHPKCCSDATSWQRRVNASNALKSYLDVSFPSQKVWVIGDFNDDVDTSIYAGHASPYANFVNDSARYKFPTKALSDAGVASTTSFPDMVDHHLNSNEASALYLASSAEVYRVDAFIGSYGTTTSDHYPLLSRYSWGGGSGGAADVIINEIGANEPGSDTAGEFVELVNVGAAAANLGGWTLRDGTSTRHTFTGGTTLAAGKSIVVFGGASGIPGGLTNAVAASTGGLSLGNSGDTVTLEDSAGSAIDGFSYSSTLASSDGVSINLSPDGNAAGSFVKHNTISGLSRSAGTRANGSAW